MKSAIVTKYGSPDVIQIRDVEQPTPKHNEVLIKVQATTVTATECILRQGKPFISRLFMGLTKPKLNVFGEEFAGEVVAIGRNVNRFKVGDAVFGSTGSQFGANAEYICLNETAELVINPSNISFEEAAASVDGVLTALPFLRDKGNIQSGQRVLIYGASGSIGTAAVQLAKYFGAEVTGVCSGSNLELVKSIGADKVLDYTKEKIFTRSEKYHIIFDTVGKASFSKCKSALATNGIFLEAGIKLGLFPQVLLTSIVGNKKAKFYATGLRPPNEKLSDLHFLKELFEKGKYKAVIDRRYPLDQIAEAHRYVDLGHKKGNVVVLF